MFTFTCVSCGRKKKNKERAKISQTLGKFGGATIVGTKDKWCITCYRVEEDRSIREDMVPGSSNRTRFPKYMIDHTTWHRNGY